MSQASALATQQKSTTEFVPFGSTEAIKLSVQIVRDLICVPTRSGKLCDDRQAMKFVMLCRSKGLNPFEGDAYLVGYDSKDGPTFSLITAHQAFLKRAELHPEYDGMESGVIVRTERNEIVDREGDFTFEDDTLLGAWAVVFFKNRKHPIKRRLKLSAFRKDYGRWRDDAAGMIVKCAEADALRSAFPTKMGGMYLEQELGVSKLVEPPTALPTGRVSVRNGAAKNPADIAPTPEPEHLETEAEPVESRDEPPPPPAGNQEAGGSADRIDDFVDSVQQEIQQATTAKEIHRALERITEAETWLPESWTKTLKAEVQQKSAALTNKAMAASGKRTAGA